MIRYIGWYKYALLWMGVIAVLSLLPAQDFDNKQVDGLDLVIHFFFYGVLVWFLALANVRAIQQSGIGRYPVLVAFAIAVAYGLLMELLQGTVFVTRSMSGLDILANSVGSTFSAALFRVVYGAPNQYY